MSTNYHQYIRPSSTSSLHSLTTDSSDDSSDEWYEYSSDSDEESDEESLDRKAPIEKKSILIFCATSQSLRSYKAIKIVEELLENVRVKVDKNNVYFKSEGPEYFKWDYQDSSSKTLKFSELPNIGIVLSGFCPCYGPKEEPFPTILLALKSKLELLGFYIDPMPIPKDGPCSKEQQELSNLTWLQESGIKKADNKGFQEFKIFRKISSGE